MPTIIRRFAPSADGGERSRRSRSVRLSRPIDIERWWSIGSRISGEFSGEGGISWEVKWGDVGAGGEGDSTRRYQGIEGSEEDTAVVS